MYYIRISWTSLVIETTNQFTTKTELITNKIRSVFSSFYLPVNIVFSTCTGEVISTVITRHRTRQRAREARKFACLTSNVWQASSSRQRRPDCEGLIWHGVGRITCGGVQISLFFTYRSERIVKWPVHLLTTCRGPSPPIGTFLGRSSHHRGRLWRDSSCHLKIRQETYYCSLWKEAEDSSSRLETWRFDDTNISWIWK